MTHCGMWVVDIECPPGGHLLAVECRNGDCLRVEFREIASASEASKRCPAVATILAEFAYPLVTVDFQVKVGALGLDFGSNSAQLPGQGMMRGCLFENSPIAITLGPSPQVDPDLIWKGMWPPGPTGSSG